MRKTDERLDELSRARLAYVVPGAQPLPGVPRRAAAQDTGDTALPAAGIEDLEAWAPHDFDHAGHAGPERADAVLRSGAERPDRPPWQGASALDRARRFVAGHLSAVCAVLALGLLCTAAVVLRARPTTVDLEAPPAATTPLATTTRASTAGVPSGHGGMGGEAARGVEPTAQPARIQVHVAGAVVRPGVVTLIQGARVADALAAAGGRRPTARLGQLNLAAPLADGDQLWVGDAATPGAEVRPAGRGAQDAPASSSTAAGPAPPGGGGGGAGPGVQVDLNRATLDQLDQLPGIGPVTAQRILDWRDQHGPFTRIEELQEVDGIGPKTYAQLRSHVRA